MAFYWDAHFGGSGGVVHSFRLTVVQPPVENLRGFAQLVCGAFDFVGDCFRIG